MRFRALQLTDTLKYRVGSHPTEVDISLLLNGYILECVGRTALGRSFGALDQDGTEYSRALRRFGYVPSVHRALFSSTKD